MSDIITWILKQAKYWSLHNSIQMDSDNTAFIGTLENSDTTYAPDWIRLFRIQLKVPFSNLQWRGCCKS